MRHLIHLSQVLHLAKSSFGSNASLSMPSRVVAEINPACTRDRTGVDQIYAVHVTLFRKAYLSFV